MFTKMWSMTIKSTKTSVKTEGGIIMSSIVGKESECDSTHDQKEATIL